MRIPLWPTILTLLALTILISLGTWQLQRLHWKTTILNELDKAYSADSSQLLDLDKAQSERFAYGQISGRFEADKAFFFGFKTKNNQIGKDLIVPVRVTGRDLLVNMGWTPVTSVSDLPIHHVNNKTLTISGLTRRPEDNAFSSQNSPDNDIWLRYDIGQMAKAKNLENPYPFIMFAHSANYKFDAAFPNNERWYPRNKHLQYALFWYGMGIILVVIYILRFVVSPSRAA